MDADVLAARRLGRLQREEGYQETLRRVEENDDTLKTLQLREGTSMFDFAGRFYSKDCRDYSKLGAAIGENTHLTMLEVDLSNDGITFDVINNTRFYEGLKRNTSIYKLDLSSSGIGNNIGSEVGQKILEAYQENNNLTLLRITNSGLQNGGENIATTLRSCTNLKEIQLSRCNITDEVLIQIVDVIRGHIISLERLSLVDNRIRNFGCGAIATLLQDPNCNLHSLDLRDNILFRANDFFSRLLCNTSSINSIYSSNHTLENLSLYRYGSRGDSELASLLKMNKGTNKSHVAIKKILKYHPNIDMEPLFEWNMEGEGERNLKALPYVIAWFERAQEAVAGTVSDSEESSVDEGEANGKSKDCERYKIDKRKLAVTYQFAQAMPLLFVPTSHMKGGDNKRKRDESSSSKR